MRLIIIHSVLLSLAYGLEFEPQLDSGSRLIYYRSGEKTTSLRLRNRLDALLAPYTEPRSDKTHFVICENGVAPEKGSNQVCDVNVTQWFPCVSSRSYNYNVNNQGPCVFLKLRKEPNWIPEYYNSSTIPEIMPQLLKDEIRAAEKRYGPDSNPLKVVWVSCEGKLAADKENIGPAVYLPKFGFDGQYFPIRNKDKYLSPLVAVQFENPTRAVLINIQCKAWARNLNKEVVHFELLAD